MFSALDCSRRWVTIWGSVSAACKKSLVKINADE